MDDGCRKHRPRARVQPGFEAAPFRQSIGAAWAIALAMPWRWSAATSTPRRVFTASAAPRNRWWRSRAPSWSIAIFSCSTSPTASLPADEVDRLFDAIRRLKARHVGMIYVSHRLDEIFRIADRVVDYAGRAQGGREARRRDDARRTREPYRGPLQPRTVPEGAAAGRSGPGSRGGSRDAGRGSGLVRHPSGRTPRSRGPSGAQVRRRSAGRSSAPYRIAGEILLDGVAPDLSSTGAALEAGIGLVARDRAEESVCPSLSIRENCFLNPGASGRTLFSPLSPRTEAQRASALGASVGLRP